MDFKSSGKCKKGHGLNKAEMRSQFRGKGRKNVPLVASAVGAGDSSFFSSFFIIPSNSLVILLKNDMMEYFAGVSDLLKR